MKIYLACALTHVPRDVFGDYCAFLHLLAEHLRGEPPRRQVRYALVDSDPDLALKPVEERARQCYVSDGKMVEEADLVVAEASFPGIGLGIELEIAQAQQTPILLCFTDTYQNRSLPAQYVNPDGTNHHLQIGDGVISLMALGLPMVRGVIKYDSAQDGLARVTEAVDALEDVCSRDHKGDDLRRKQYRGWSVS